MLLQCMYTHTQTGQICISDLYLGVSGYHTFLHDAKKTFQFEILHQSGPTRRKKISHPRSINFIAGWVVSFTKIVKNTIHFTKPTTYPQFMLHCTDEGNYYFVLANIVLLE